MPDFSIRVRRRAGRGDGILLGVGLLALTASAYATSAAWAELRGIERSAEAERREAAALAARAQTLESVHEGGGESLAPRILLNTESPPPRVLADLTALLPPDVRLDGVSLVYGRRVEVDARVVARGALAYDRFLKHLGESPLFESVVPGPENRDGEVQASVQMSYRGDGR